MQYCTTLPRVPECGIHKNCKPKKTVQLDLIRSFATTVYRLKQFYTNTNFYANLASYFSFVCFSHGR